MSATSTNCLHKVALMAPIKHSMDKCHWRISIAIFVYYVMQKLPTESEGWGGVGCGLTANRHII